jgi:hypothetical protein
VVDLAPSKVVSRSRHRNAHGAEDDGDHREKQAEKNYEWRDFFSCFVFIIETFATILFYAESLSAPNSAPYPNAFGKRSGGNTEKTKELQEISGFVFLRASPLFFVSPCQKKVDHYAGSICAGVTRQVAS